MPEHPNTPEFWLAEILRAVWKLDDKPHQLFSRLRAAVLDQGENLGFYQKECDEMIRLLDLAYDNVNLKESVLGHGPNG